MPQNNNENNHKFRQRKNVISNRMMVMMSLLSGLSPTSTKTAIAAAPTGSVAADRGMEIVKATPLGLGPKQQSATNLCSHFLLLLFRRENFSVEESDTGQPSRDNTRQNV